MIQTSYVPLEHPYRVIEYNGTLGIQIGTLIVTVDKSEYSEGVYAIETHSHPVVSYVNNKMRTDLKNFRSLSLPRPYEGVAWDKVELHQLRTFVWEGETLTWSDYMDFCRRLRLSELEGTRQNVGAAIMDNYGMLLDWGIDIDLPKGAKGDSNTLVMELSHYEKYGDNEYLMIGGDMGIVVRRNDLDLMIGQIYRQVDFFLSFMEYLDIYDCKVKFWTEDLFMQDLTEELNDRWARYEQDKLPHQPDEDYGMLWAAEDIAEPHEDE